jgi:outer membrane lipoprotein-sorting protein
MNKFLTCGIQKPLFLFTLVLLFAVQTQAQTVNAILIRVENHRKALTSLQADISMEKYDPTLRERSVQTGQILLAPKTNKIKDALFRIDWEKPRKEILAVANGKYVAYTPSLEQAYTGKASNKQAQNKGGSALSFLTMTKAEMNANYTAKYIGEEKLDGNIPTWHLSFLPKTDPAYKSVDVWVDGNGMILQVKSVPASGDESTIRLTNLQKNIKLKGSQFIVELPKGLKPIKG